MTFAVRLQRAREAAGLSQAALARRAGTSQARVSSYERGLVTPTPATRERLLSALRPLPSVMLDRHRKKVTALAGGHKLGNVRVFGSVASGRDTTSSDVDLLVAADPEASLLDLSAFADDVEQVLGYEVDVVTDRGLAPTSPIVRDAVRL